MKAMHATLRGIPRVEVILTDGTFDKVYDILRERLMFSENNSSFANIAQNAFIGDVSVRQLMKMDSLDMAAADRATIVRAIESTEVDHILVVHGTNTLLKTAEHLSDQFGQDKTIVLTGALRPASYEITEAACNVGIGLCAARYFPGGVYVAIHGIVSTPDLLRKDEETGRFVLKAT